LFDNVLHQAKTVELLSQEVSSRTLPASLLFHGPRYSAKLTGALETARALSCLKDGAWSCTCDHCRAHRTLDYPWLILAGPKTLLPEIEAAAGLLKLHRTEPRRFSLLRSVKKLLKRFDPVLWEGDENKLKGAAALAALQDDLETLYPPAPLSGDLVLDRIVESCRSLAGTLPSGGLPIHQVRKISTWARTTSAGAPKFVIFENADRMQEGSRNALLKILEEPPAGTWFFLLTSQKGAVMPTILSRLRPFAFAGRTPSQEQEILTSLFQAEPGAWSGLDDYFQAFETQKQGLFADLANTFLEGLANGVFPLESYGKFWAEEDNYSHFLKALAETVAAGERPLRQRERLFRLVHEALTRRETYNLSAPLLIETLFYQCRSAG
jgi:DNA polymerase-3 subunit gamma/tau